MKKLPMLLAIITLPVISLTAVAEDKCTAGGTVSVAGNGMVQAMPDLAILSFSARHQDPNQKVARDTVEKTISIFILALEKAGVKKEQIKADSLYLSPRYSYKDNESKLIGFEATRDISIETSDLATIGSLVDLAIESGINEAAGFNYKVKDLKPYQDKATALAIEDAKKKAQLLADGFGVKLDKPCSLSFANYAQPALYRANNYKLLSTEDAAENTYVQKEMTVNVEVNAVFSIK